MALDDLTATEVIEAIVNAQGITKDYALTRFVAAAF